MADDEDQAMFEEALASLSPRDVFRGKYGSGEAAQKPAEEPTDPASREEIQRLRELREMENAFAGVEPIERGKIRAAPIRDDLTRGEADELRAEFEAALVPAAKPEPEPVRRRISEEAGDDVHSINLRGMDVDRALGKLGLFVDFASKDGHRLMRVRIGSNPPLLKAVQHWFETAGLAYVEELELTQAHADAAIFARIRCTDGS